MPLNIIIMFNYIAKYLCQYKMLNPVLYYVFNVDTFIDYLYIVQYSFFDKQSIFIPLLWFNPNIYWSFWWPIILKSSTSHLIYFKF